MDISNIKVTDQDVKDFKSFKIGTYNQPRLRSLFKTDKEYIDYMKDYMEDHITLKNDPAVIQESKFDVQNQKYSITTKFKTRLNKAFSNKEYQLLDQIASDFQKAYADGFMECNQYSIRKDGTKIIVDDKVNGETTCFNYPDEDIKSMNGDFNDLSARSHMVTPFNLNNNFSKLDGCIEGFSKNLGIIL